MNELLIAALGFVALLALILVRLPIAAAMAIVGVGGTAWVAGWPAALATLKQGPFERASSYTLVVVPLFLLMGYLASRAGLSQKLFHAANVWLGQRGGHGHHRGLCGLRGHLRLIGGHGDHDVLRGLARDAALSLC